MKANKINEKELIMADRKASAIWEGTLKAGKGNMHFDGYDGPFTFASRFEEGKGTNPEELLGAAHAGCFSMALSAGLTEAGFPPEKIETIAHIALRNVDGKATIIRSHLVSKAKVPGITNEKFLEIAEATKLGCPVSRALGGVEISLEAELID
jgi:osmotically inducible protein OsmC